MLSRYRYTRTLCFWRGKSIYFLKGELLFITFVDWVLLGVSIPGCNICFVEMCLVFIRIFCGFCMSVYLLTFILRTKLQIFYMKNINVPRHTSHFVSYLVNIVIPLKIRWDTCKDAIVVCLEFKRFLSANNMRNLWKYTSMCLHENIIVSNLSNNIFAYYTFLIL